MNRADREPLVRLIAINRSVGELLLRMVKRQNGERLTAGSMRAVGHELVSLAGDLTTLGVDMARWADELDRTTGSSQPVIDDTPMS